MFYWTRYCYHGNTAGSKPALNNGYKLFFHTVVIIIIMTGQCNLLLWLASSKTGDWGGAWPSLVWVIEVFYALKASGLGWWSCLWLNSLPQDELWIRCRLMVMGKQSKKHLPVKGYPWQPWRSLPPRHLSHWSVNSVKAQTYLPKHTWCTLVIWEGRDGSKNMQRSAKSEIGAIHYVQQQMQEKIALSRETLCWPWQATCTLY